MQMDAVLIYKSSSKYAIRSSHSNQQDPGHVQFKMRILQRGSHYNLVISHEEKNLLAMWIVFKITVRNQPIANKEKYDALCTHTQNLKPKRESIEYRRKTFTFNLHT